jgi:hypothetical protein
VSGGARLGIDFGTSSTVAVIFVDDRSPRPLLFDGSPLLRSAVCADPTGRLLVGREAVQMATASPGGFEPHPKRCVDDGSVLLDGHEVPVDALFAAVFGRVTEQAARFGDGTLAGVTVTHPAGWGSARKATLQRAAPAGARLVPEPVAAAHFFVDIAGHHMPDAAAALVYDLGAGTFDASIVRRAGRGFEVLATTGLPDAGGLDIDAAIVAYLRATVAGEATWASLTDPDGPAAYRARQQLWDNVRGAKEVLTRLSTTLIHLPLFDLDVPLGREQLDLLAAPLLDRTIRATRDLLNGADTRPVAVFLAGGASRMPAVATSLHRALGIAPSIVDEPELAVAEGSLRVPPPQTATTPGTPATLGTSAAYRDDSWPPPETAAAPAIARTTARSSIQAAARRRGLRAAMAGVALAVLLATGTAVWIALPDRDPDTPFVAADPTGDTGADPTATQAPSPSPSPSLSLRPGIDRCLLGTWRMVSSRSDATLDNAQAQWVGGKGATRTFNADGISVLDYDKSAKLVATSRGNHWELIFRGRITSRYLANGETVRWGTTTVHGTTKWTRNGRVYAREKLSVRMDPYEYACTDTRLISSSGQDSAEWIRM